MLSFTMPELLTELIYREQFNDVHLTDRLQLGNGAC
jgi:hypothetical protein